MNRSFDVAVETGAVENDPEKVAQSLWHLVTTNRLCSIATVATGPLAHINTCFYAPTSNLSLVIFTAPSARHSQNLEENDSFGATIFDSHQEWGGTILGAQLFGRARRCGDAQADAALRVYTEHNPGMAEWAPTTKAITEKFESRLYILSVQAFTLLDEATFGKEGYIGGRIEGRRGEL